MDVQAHEREEHEWQQKEVALTDQLVAARARVAKLEEDALMAAEEKRLRDNAAEDRDAAVQESLELLRQARALQTAYHEMERANAKLRAELERERSLLREVVEQARAQQLRIAALETERTQLQRINQSLAEDCESYTVLLEERTISGELMQSSAVIKKGQQEHGRSGSHATSVDLAEELHRAVKGSGGKLGSPTLGSPQPNHRGYPSISSTALSPRASFSGTFGEEYQTMSRSKHLEQDVHRLNAEIRQLKEDNRALHLYINKILSRVFEAGHLENVVSEEGTIQGHRKTLSQTGQIDQGNDKGWRRHQSMIVSKSGAAGMQAAIAEAGKNGEGAPDNAPAPGTDEGGLLRKAFKRMSTWRASTASTVTVTPSIESKDEIQLSKTDLIDETNVDMNNQDKIANDTASAHTATSMKSEEIIAAKVEEPHLTEDKSQHVESTA